ncbi:radical SAM protein [archaeon]|jgi:uncharacterized protein|nr:radical SAM protein [archaeon]MBT6698369.1 radical SAM protein [archaeon]
MSNQKDSTGSIPLNIIKNKDDTSFYAGTLPKGCQHCIKGGKLVIFITGLCPQRCYYCPVSEEKFAKDRIFANEREITNQNEQESIKELIDEAKLMDATGAGITGGDPLAVLKRCTTYITVLKKTFGKDFHIHLYTPMKLVTKETLAALHKAGLDEIRFHPDLDNMDMWPRLKLATEFNWDIGLEIPCLPDKKEQTISLIDYAKDFVSFVNLNELEFSDTTVSHYKLSEHNYVPKNDTSYGVKGSAELGLELIKYSKQQGYDKNPGLTIYFCPSRLKDKTQMGNRMKRRANNVKLLGDIVTSEGTLVRGIIYLKELAPGFGYNKQIKEIAKDKIKCQKLLEQLQEAKEQIENLSKSQETTINQEIMIDERKLRIITSKDFVTKNAQKLKQIDLLPAIVEEYPSYDSLELEIEFL